MAIAEVVQTSITESVGSTALANFDTPALLAAVADTPGAAYASVKAVKYPLTTAGQATVGEDWGDSGDTYDAFSQMLAQTPKADYCWIIERSAEVATVKTITFSGAHSSGHGGTFVINGQSGSWAYATSNAATLTALAAAIQALDGIATAASDGTSVITVTGDASWNLDISVSTTGTTPPTAAVATSTAGNHAGNDVAAALAEEATNLWYGIATADTDTGAILSVAAAIAGNEKYFSYQTNEAGAKSSGDTTNVGSYMYAKNYRDTLGFWKADTTEFASCAALAKYLAYAPGTIALAGMTLAGVTVDTLTASEVTTLKARGLNTYRAFSPTDSAFNWVRDGIRADGKRAEATRNLDYMQNAVRVAGLLYVASQHTNPQYNQEGLDAWEACLNVVLADMVREKILDGSANAAVTPVVIVPRFSAISSGDKALFKFPNGKLRGQLLNSALVVEAAIEVQIQ